MEQLSAERKTRSSGIDLLKVIAIVGVIMIHTCAEGGYSYPVGSLNWLSTLFWGSVSRASVPIFLMCSGALLLEPSKKLTVKRLYLHNILRILIAMVVWSMFYKVVELLKTDAFTLRNLYHSFKEVLLFKQNFHFYYLHIILLVYAFLPVTRCLVANASRRQLEYTLILWFLLGIVYPTINPYWPLTQISGMPKQWLMNMSYAAIGYGMLGYYIKKYPIKKPFFLLSGAAGFMIVFFGTWIKSAKSGGLNAFFFEGMSLGVCLFAFGIFGMCMAAEGKIRPGASKVLKWFSNASFCIYLVHVFFLRTYRDLGFSTTFFCTAVSIPAVTLLLLALSSIVYLVLSKIPVIKSWLV